jgi:phosphatidylglycerol lysyltransferase
VAIRSRVSPSPEPDDRARVLSLLRKHGWNATSFQVLERGFRYWFADDDACVAYVDTGRAWLAAGAPIASAARLAEVAAAFCEAARRERRRCAFFAVEERFAVAPAFRLLHVGEQPVWDPAAWDATVRGSRSLKEQLRRARAKGVRVRVLDAGEVESTDSAARRGVEALIERWFGSRSMAPMGFLVDVQPFDFASERRYVIAERDGRPVGFAAAVPIYGRGGWFLEDLIREPSAPNGTAELLIDALLRRVAEEGSRYATLGLAPLSGPVRGFLRTARDRAAVLYDFNGLRAFKARLRPARWDPVYLAHPAGSSGTVALYDSLAAFARGSFARFALQTVLRGPAIVVRVLAALLVPWTILLALADRRHWFPNAWVQRGWVLFDVALVVGLFALAARWRRWLGVLLASLVTLDATLTLIEAVVYNLPRSQRASDLMVVALSCLAPASAAVILWSGLRLRARVEALGAHPGATSNTTE